MIVSVQHAWMHWKVSFMTPEEYTKLNEGLRLACYIDSRGVPTIGYGCTGPGIIPGATWTQEQADSQFAERYSQAQAAAQVALGLGAWSQLDEVRQAALTDMAFQLGGAGLRRFQQMLAAVRASAWQMAHDECLESAYAKQTPARCFRTAQMLLTGNWPVQPF